MNRSIILVVDDVAANREILRGLIDAPDYQVVEAADGSSALQLALATPPDLVLLDVKMPGMDGYEVCRRLRADTHLAAVPVILVTALDDQASRLAGIEAGADDFITKPINRVELRARVRTITRLNRYRRLLEVQTLLRESEQKFLSVFQNAAVGLVIAEPPEIRIIEANRRLCEMLGYTAAELRQMTSRDITHPDEIAQDLQSVAQVNSGKIQEYSREKRYRKKDGSCVWAKVFVAPLDPLGTNGTRMIAVIEDITAKKQADEYSAMSLEVLRILNEPGDLPDTVQRVVASLKTRTGFDAVGIRLQGGEDFPYLAQQGFSKDFLLTENTLLARAADGGICRNQDDSVCLECTCGLVISGRTDPANPLFTRGGSCWTNDSFPLLDIPVSEDPRLHPRNKCVHQGYASVALVPIRDKERIVGLIQLNDRHKGRFTLATVELLEGIAAHLGAALLRKKAEAELRRSEAELHRAQEIAHIGNWSLDLQKNFVTWSAEMYRIYGTTPELFDHTPEGAAKLIHPEEKARLLKIAETLQQGRTFEPYDYRTVRPDGEIRVVHVFACDMERDTAGRPVRVVGAVQDITEQKRAEAALHESAERYRLLFESNPVPMWLSDPETLRFLAVNESAVRHYGYTREEFLAMTIKDIHPPEDISALRKARKEAPALSTRSSESRHRRKDGTVMQVEVISTPLRFDDREARLVLATDVTEKTLLEEKFLHAQRLEGVGMLAAGIAHDLNNVLAPIVFAAPLLRSSMTTPRDLKILNTLERCAERGAGLVKQILGFVHTATGERHPMQVKYLARDIIGLIEETFPKSIQLEQRIPNDLWPVEGNATQIHQVLLNLCVNARDAMPKGGTLRLVAANRQLDASAAAAIPDATPGAWLMLEVSDTGTGIPPEVLERMWTPFFTTKDIGKGTGLGLSTVRGIVASHHGFVELQTEVGRGSAFRVYLPAYEGEAPQSGSVAPFANLDHSGELILVVDDDAAFREIISDVLKQQGYRIVSCVDGMAAITAFNTHLGEVSLVVTDVDMPRLGGVELAQALLKICPGIRLIAMSGYSLSSTSASDIPAIQTLAHAFLLKPFKPDALLSAVRRVLTGAQKSAVRTADLTRQELE